MESNDAVLDWLIWNQAVECLKQDVSRVESADSLGLPYLEGAVLRHLGSRAYAKEKEAAKNLRANGIRVVTEKIDCGEFFVLWSQRDQVDIYRIRERELRSRCSRG